MTEPQIQFACLRCAQPMLADIEDAGGIVECPNCGQDVQIPLHNTSAATPSQRADWFEFSCPTCGETMAASAADVGAEGACPGCGTVVTIPDSASATVGDKTATDDEYGWADSADGGGEEFEFSCPHCQAALMAELADVGGEVDCPTCQRTIAIPDPRDPLQILGQALAALGQLPATSQADNPLPPGFDGGPSTDDDDWDVSTTGPAIVPDGTDSSGDDEWGSESAMRPVRPDSRGATAPTTAGATAADSAAALAAPSGPTSGPGFSTDPGLNAELQAAFDDVDAAVGGDYGADTFVDPPDTPYVETDASDTMVDPPSAERKVVDESLAGLLGARYVEPEDDDAEADELLAALMEDDSTPAVKSTEETRRVEAAVAAAPAPFVFDCRHCQKPIEANRGMVGLKITCPACRIIQPIPDPATLGPDLGDDDRALLAEELGDGDGSADEESDAPSEPTVEELSKDLVREIHRGMLKKAGPFFANTQGIDVAIHKAKPKEAPLLFALCYRPTPLIIGFTEQHILVSFPEQRRLVVLKPWEAWLQTKFKKSKPPSDGDESGKPGTVMVRAFKLGPSGGKEAIGEIAFEFADDSPESKTALGIKKLVKPWMHRHPFIQKLQKGAVPPRHGEAES